MAVTAEGQENVKAVTCTYDQSAVEGKYITISAGDPLEEKRESPNDGEFQVFFPESFSGSCDLSVEGSKGGTESGTIEVE